MSKLTPNKALYDKFRPAVGKQMKAVLILAADATWHICRSRTSADTPLMCNITEVWEGYEQMLNRTTYKALRSLHQSLFGFAAPTEAKMTMESLCVIIWNYRCYHAIDHTLATPSVKAGDPIQRHSSIAGRTYTVITPSPNAKPYTSPAAMACLKIITTCCEKDGYCTEADLKVAIMARASEITPKTDSAWRFLQFYRPLLVKAERILYDKTSD